MARNGGDSKPMKVEESNGFLHEYDLLVDANQVLVSEEDDPIVICEAPQTLEPTEIATESAEVIPGNPSGYLGDSFSVRATAAEASKNTSSRQTEDVIRVEELAEPWAPTNEVCTVTVEESRHMGSSLVGQFAGEKQGEESACRQAPVNEDMEAHVDAPTSAPVCSSSPPTVLGDVEVSFLGGHSVLVSVHAGQSMATVKAEVFHSRPPPKGLLPQLVHPTGVIQGDESAADFVGIPLTALFTRLPLSDEARELLRRCTLRSPEDGCIDLLEVCFKLKVEDMDGFVELLVQVQPRRLLLANALLQHTLSILANSLKSNLEVEAMHLPATKDGLGDISKLLQRCPCLRNCRLSNGGLNASDVAGLRAEVAAAIVI